MTRKIFSFALLLAGIGITFGAYGHGFVGRLEIDAELAKHALATDTFTMLYVVWYMLSGCMAYFGVTVLLAWNRLRRGRDVSPLALHGIGALYLAVGLAGIVYRDGDPFMSVFIVLGALVTISTFVLTGRKVDAPALAAAVG